MTAEAVDAAARVSGGSTSCSGNNSNNTLSDSPSPSPCDSPSHIPAHTLSSEDGNKTTVSSSCAPIAAVTSASATDEQIVVAPTLTITPIAAVSDVNASGTVGDKEKEWDSATSERSTTVTMTLVSPSALSEEKESVSVAAAPISSADAHDVYYDGYVEAFDATVRACACMCVWCLHMCMHVSLMFGDVCTFHGINACFGKVTMSWYRRWMVIRKGMVVLFNSESSSDCAAMINLKVGRCVSSGTSSDGGSAFVMPLT